MELNWVVSWGFVLTSPGRGRSCWGSHTCLWGWLCGGAGASGADWAPESLGPSSSASCWRVWPPLYVWCRAGRSAWQQRNDPWWQKTRARLLTLHTCCASTVYCKNERRKKVLLPAQFSNLSVVRLKVVFPAHSDPISGHSWERPGTQTVRFGPYFQVISFIFRF